MSGGHGHVEGSNKKIALLVAVLAAFLAISEMGGKSSQTEVLTQHVEASNLWTFFQAKTIRQTVDADRGRGARGASTRTARQACRRRSRPRSSTGARRRSATTPSRRPTRGARN